MNDFQRGYICAVSCMVHGHGAGVEAEEALRALGPFNWDEMEPYDRKILEPLREKVTR